MLAKYSRRIPYYKELNLSSWTSVKQACDSSRWVCEMRRARVVLNSVYRSEIWCCSQPPFFLSFPSAPMPYFVGVHLSLLEVCYVHKCTSLWCMCIMIFAAANWWVCVHTLYYISYKSYGAVFCCCFFLLICIWYISWISRYFQWVLLEQSRCILQSTSGRGFPLGLGELCS